MDREHERSSLPRLFVGGTGRSGTTILNQILGEHPQVHSFPSEMRFLIDSGGLMNLVDAFSVRYSITQAREALFRFDHLMRIDLCTPGQRPYPRHDFSDWLGASTYFHELDRFLADLTESCFDGDLRFRPEPGSSNTASAPPLLVPRLFPDRATLIERARQFVDAILSAPLASKGKQTWCEKTPLNLVHLDFLQELFPQSMFLHVVRDPRGVVESLMRMSWAPSDLEGACRYLLSTLQRWDQLAPHVARSADRYLEIRLEDLARDPRATLASVAQHCGIEPDWGRLPPMELDRVESWRTRLDENQKRILTQRLEPWIASMGYVL